MDGPDNWHHVAARYIGCYDAGLGISALYLYNFLVVIRQVAAADWPNIWPIFSEITKARGTYTYPADADTTTAKGLWLKKTTGPSYSRKMVKFLGPIILRLTKTGLISTSVNSVTWFAGRRGAWVR